MRRGHSRFPSRAPSGLWGGIEIEEPDPEEQERLLEVLEKFRRFRPYLNKRLKKILADGREREFVDLVDDIRYYLNVMNDLMADEHHGLDTIQGFIESIQEMMRTDPLKPDEESLLDSNDEEDEGSSSSKSDTNPPGQIPDDREKRSSASNNPYQDKDTRHLANDIWNAPTKDHLNFSYDRRSETGSRTLNDIRSYPSETLRCGGRGKAFQPTEVTFDNFGDFRRTTSGRGRSARVSGTNDRNREGYRDTENRNSEYDSQDHQHHSDFDELYERRPKNTPASVNTSRKPSFDVSPILVDSDNDSWDYGKDNYEPYASNSPNSCSIPPNVTNRNNTTNSNGFQTPINMNIPLPPESQLQEMIHGMVASAIEKLSPQMQQQGVNPQHVTQLLSNNPNLVPFNMANNPTLNQQYSSTTRNQNESRIFNQNPGCAAPPYSYGELFPNQPVQNQFRFPNPNARMFRPPFAQSQLYSQGNFGNNNSDNSDRLKEIREKAQQHFMRSNPGVRIKPTKTRMDLCNPHFQRGIPRAPASLMAGNQITADPPVIGDPRLRVSKANRNSQGQITNSAIQSQNQGSENEPIDMDTNSYPSKRRVEHSQSKNKEVLKNLTETRKKVANSIPTKKTKGVSKIAELRKELEKMDMLKLGNNSQKSKKPSFEDTSPSKASSCSSESQKSKISNVGSDFPAHYDAESESGSPEKRKRGKEEQKNPKGANYSSGKFGNASKSCKTTKGSKNKSMPMETPIPSSSKLSANLKHYKIPKRGDPIKDKPFSMKLPIPVYSKISVINEGAPSSTTSSQDDSEDLVNSVQAFVLESMSSEDLERLNAASTDPEVYKEIQNKLQEKLTAAVAKNQERDLGLRRFSKPSAVKRIKSLLLEHSPAKESPRPFKSDAAVIEEVQLANKKNSKTKEKRKKKSQVAKKLSYRRQIPANKVNVARKRLRVDSVVKTNNIMENKSTEEKSGAESISDGDIFPKRYHTRLQARKNAIPEMQPRDPKTGWEKWTKRLKYLRVQQKRNRIEMNKKFLATFKASKIKKKLKKRFKPILRLKIRKTPIVIGKHSIVINAGLCKIKLESDYVPPEVVKTEIEVEQFENLEDADMNHLNFDTEHIIPTNSVPLNDNDEDDMEDISIIDEEVKTLDLKIQGFEFKAGGTQDFNYFEAILKTHLLKLGNINADRRRESVENAKQDCIRRIYKCIDKLESKIPLPGSEYGTEQENSGSMPTVTQNLGNRVSCSNEFVENVGIPLEITPKSFFGNEDDSSEQKKTISDGSEFVLNVKISETQLETLKNGSAKKKIIFNCSLCDFSGETIVTHYVNCHRHSTIPQSRISQQEYDKLVAQNQSAEANYLEIHFGNEEFPWICLFCSEKYNDVVEYFEHLTTHTGEFRYACGLCSERHRCLKTCTAHLRDHALEDDLPSENRVTVLQSTVAPYGNELFVYICNDCNYLQLYPENIARHLENENHGPSNAICVKFKIQRNVQVKQEAIPDVKIEASESTLQQTVVDPYLQHIEN